MCIVSDASFLLHSGVFMVLDESSDVIKGIAQIPAPIGVFSKPLIDPKYNANL